MKQLFFNPCHFIRHVHMLFVAGAFVAGSPAMTPAAELVLPQNRTAYFVDEAIEIAVADLPKAATAVVELTATNAATAPFRFEVAGDGTCVNSVLPPFSLAPAVYRLGLDGQDTGLILTVVTGVNRSTMLLGSTCVAADQKRAAGENHMVGNAFSFGLLTRDGQPSKELRRRHSIGLAQFENAIRLDLPSLVYMYWTGAVLHKPWGTLKSWADPSMVETMRLFNFHTAQRIRRYGRNILYVGTIDEPGLAWGRTPAGGMASGFPNWDEQAWYETRGWKFTDDPAAGSDADWLKYLTIRCGIIKENNAWAKQDLKTVWPATVFSTDLYAPQAITDGTDPLNQEVNDIPSSHVFLDWGTGKLGVIGAIYLEKCHDPTAKIAHAMNGQLFGDVVPQPNQRDAYHLMLHGLLAAGLHNNWWLNCGGMTAADFAQVHEPVLRWGPLFREMSPAGHDVAVLWSFTELALRQKSMASREARKKTGEQIKMMVASLPENTALDSAGAELELSAYNVGGNYKEQALGIHQALNRAGYPAHIVHEKLLPRGILKNYQTLVIVGQTFELPPEVKQAIGDFQASGGRVVVDPTTTVALPGALVTEANFRDPGYRWMALFLAAQTKKFKTPREASYYESNYFMDAQVRDAVGPIQKTLQTTKSQPVFTTDSIHLGSERHVGGEGSLLMVLNAHEKLPDRAENQKHLVYNYAAHEATYALAGIPTGSVVYAIEGIDWKQVARLENPATSRPASFAAGEMKMYLVAPRAPTGIVVTAREQAGAIAVTAGLQNLQMPWPLTVTLRDAGGKELYRVYRSMNVAGQYEETFPVGANAPAGACLVRVESPVAGLVAETTVEFRPAVVKPTMLSEVARVFDEAAIRSFLGSKPALVIAVGAAAHQPQADALARELSAKGIPTTVTAEAKVFRRALYPRVWNSYARLCKPTGDEKPSTNVQQRVELQLDDDGRTRAMTPDGKDLGAEWQKPNTLATVVGKGFVDWSGDSEICYEPGCKLLVEEGNRIRLVYGEPTEVKTTAEFRARWTRPWTTLSSYHGGYQVPPQLPEAYAVDPHLVLLGDSTTSELVSALQASELLTQVVDEKYPGPGKALVSFAWSPFALEKNVILVGATDAAGLKAGAQRLLSLAPR